MTDIVFRRHPVGDDEDSRTRKEAPSGSPLAVNRATSAAGKRLFSSTLKGREAELKKIWEAGVKGTRVV